MAVGICGNLRPLFFTLQEVFMKRILSALLLVVFLAAPAFAGDYDFTIPSDLGNDTFKSLVKEAGAMVAYRSVAPAEPGGLTGFDIGVAASFVEVDTDVWDQVFESQDTPGYVTIPKVHLRKGLPFGIDIGASYSMVPDSNIEVLGGEIQIALMDGSAALPALALRGHYSTLLGVDDLDLEVYGGDVVLSKGLLMFTPYIGAGMLQTKGEYTGNIDELKSTLKDQDETTTRFFGGVQIAMALLRITLDAEYADEVPVYTAKVSLGW
jgi:opacity protein-like surface antigen